MQNSLLRSFQRDSNSLIFNNKYFIKRVSKGARKKKLNKYYEQHPNLFRKISRIRPPDLTRNNIVFPINIPVKFRYVYRPIKNRPKLPLHDFLNFKQMTGNQILIHLENPDILRPSELCGALIELSKRPGHDKQNWGEHEWIKNVINHCTKKMPTYNIHVVSYLIMGFHRLRITNQELWKALQVACDKTMHKYSPKGFAYTYVAFLEHSDRCSPEFKAKLASRLPIFLHKMNQLLITKCFQLTIANKLMNDHLFDNHFHLLFWKRTQWFGPNCYPHIIRGMIEMNYSDDKDFWDDSFLPGIKKMEDKYTEESATELLSALKELKSKFPNIKCDDYIEFLKNKIVYCQTKLKNIENAKFYNIVLNDLEYYRQKQLLKMNKKAHKDNPADSGSNEKKEAKATQSK